MRPESRQEAVAVGVLLAATLLVGAPLLAGETFPARDTAFTLVNLDHLQDVLLHGAPLARGPLGWPLADSLAQTDLVSAQALLGLPLRLLGVDPVREDDVLVLLGFFLTSWAVHRLAVALVGPGPHTWVAGAIGGLGPVQAFHGQHVNLVHQELAILGPLLLGAGLPGRPRSAAAGGLLTALSFHFGVYVGLHALLGALAVAVFAPKDARAARSGLLGFLGGAATVAPFAVIWLRAAREYGVTVGMPELHDDSWHLARTLAPVDGAPLHVPLDAVWPRLGRASFSDPANPGYLATALALVGLWTARRGGTARDGARWGWTGNALLAVAVVSLVLALGPDLIVVDAPIVSMPYKLAMQVGGQGLTAPARWLAVAFVCLAPVAAAGFRRVVPARWSVPAGLLAVLVVVGESPRLRTSPREAIALEPVYAALDDVTTPGAIYDEALRHQGDCDGKGGQAILAALYHGRPLVGGTYARPFEAAEDVGRIAGQWPADETVRWFEANAVTVVLEHPPLGALPTAPGVTCKEVDGHRICQLPLQAAFEYPAPNRSIRDALMRGHPQR